MTERATVIQARISADDARQLDSDVRELGLTNRSDAVREGLRLLHLCARHAALARDYDSFYGKDAQAPISELAAIGDRLAGEAIAASNQAG